MALTIIPKYSGDSLEPIGRPSRLSVPLFQSTISLNELYPIFIQCASLGTTLYWHDGYFDVSTGYDPGTFVKESSLGLDFYWDSGLLEVSINSMDYAYVDGSFAARDASITYLYNWDYAKDASIIALRLKDTQIDANIQQINDLQYLKYLKDVSIVDECNGQMLMFEQDSSLWENIDSIDADATFTTFGYVDGSLNAKQDNIPDGTYLKESSLGTDFVWNAGQLDVSIVSGYSTTYIDGSLNTLKAKDASQDTSIGNLNDWNIVQDASIIRLDASISDLYSSKQDNIPDGTFLKEVSLGTDFVWNAGQLDVSVEGKNYDSSIVDIYSYVDGSLANKMPWTKTGVYHTTDISDGDYWWMRWDGSTFSAAPDGSVNVFFTGNTGPYGPYARFNGTNPLILLEKGWTLGVDMVQRFMTVDRDDYVDSNYVKNTSLGITTDVVCDGSVLHFTGGILTSIT